MTAGNDRCESARPPSHSPPLSQRQARRSASAGPIDREQGESALETSPAALERVMGVDGRGIMKVAIRAVNGNWTRGLVLDKHSVSSTPIGINEYGHTIWDTLRTEVGEATFKLKYRGGWDQVDGLANQVVASLWGYFPNIGLIVPMPASRIRDRQPVTEVARAVGALTATPVFENLLVKAQGGPSLKNLNTKAEKIAAIGNSLSVQDVIQGVGPWNVLLIDDLFHTGASAEAACAAMASSPKIAGIYLAALTWR